jgi:hypothetical protein
MTEQRTGVENWNELFGPTLDPPLTEEVAEKLEKDKDNYNDQIDRYLSLKVHTPILNNHFCHVQSNICPLCEKPTHCLFYCEKCNTMRCRYCWKEWDETLECAHCRSKVRRDELTFTVYFKDGQVRWDYRRIPFFYYK